MVLPMNEMQRLRVHRDMRSVVPDLSPQERQQEGANGKANRLEARNECSTADEGKKQDRVDRRRDP